MINAKRYDYIDIAKGFGMLAVVWGHILTAGWSWVFVYSFDIPLFFFLSGMMYNNKKYDNLFKLVKNRVRTLLIPYVFISVITWCIWVAYNVISKAEVNFFRPLLQTILAQGSGGFMVHNVPLWFVTCLFVVEIIYYFISKLPDIWNVVVCVILAAVGYFMLNNNLNFDFTLLPWNIEAAMSAIILFSFGNIFVKHCGVNTFYEFIKKKKSIAFCVWLALTAITLVLSQYNGHVTLGSNSLGNNVFLFYLIGLCGTFAVLIFSNMLTEITTPCLNSIVGGVKAIGRNSFYFMAFHVPIKGFIAVIVARLFKTSTVAVSENILLSLCVFLPTLVCTSIIVYFIVKIKERVVTKSV